MAGQRSDRGQLAACRQASAPDRHGWGAGCCVIGSPGCWGEWRNGRRAGFRCQCPSGRGGSSPPSPTILRRGESRTIGCVAFILCECPAKYACRRCAAWWPPVGSRMSTQSCADAWTEFAYTEGTSAEKIMSVSPCRTYERQPSDAGVDVGPWFAQQSGRCSTGRRTTRDRIAGVLPEHQRRKIPWPSKIHIGGPGSDRMCRPQSTTGSRASDPGSRLAVSAPRLRKIGVHPTSSAPSVRLTMSAPNTNAACPPNEPRSQHRPGAVRRATTSQVHHFEQRLVVSAADETTSTGSETNTASTRSRSCAFTYSGGCHVEIHPAGTRRRHHGQHLRSKSMGTTCSPDHPLGDALDDYRRPRPAYTRIEPSRSSAGTLRDRSAVHRPRRLRPSRPGLPGLL